MDYFIMQTDSRLRRLPQLRIPKELLNMGDTEQIKSKEAVPVIYVKGNTGLSIEYPDYIERPIPLIAEKLHKILKKYQQDTAFYQVVLIEKDTGKQKVYYMMLPPIIACTDKPKTVYNRIFRVQELKNQIVVRLDVAESILRRDANGIWFEPLKF